MKLKYLIIIGLLLLVQNLISQQVEREEVLLEGFTGTW